VDIDRSGRPKVNQSRWLDLKTQLQTDERSHANAHKKWRYNQLVRSENCVGTAAPFEFVAHFSGDSGCVFVAHLLHRAVTIHLKNLRSESIDQSFDEGSLLRAQKKATSIDCRVWRTDEMSCNCSSVNSVMPTAIVISDTLEATVATSIWPWLL
jgi:hypothetical protein